MHTEGQIRAAIRPLIEYYGELNTSEVKARIEEVLTFDEEDMIMSETRNNEIKILQRIGNIVAHQKELIRVYSEGFIVDKTTNPAKFKAIKGLAGQEKAISGDELQKKKKLIKKNEQKKRTYKKVNWELVNERRTEIGAKGEEFVYEREREYVKTFDPLSVDRVIHLSTKQGDGFGYDISSINEKGESVYIEVKTTTGKEEAPFYMSINEKAFFEDNVNNNAFVYRVYNFDENTRHGDIKKISAADLLNNYNFDPITFMVTKK